MKKLLLISMLLFPSLCFAQLNPQTEQPIYQARTLNAFSIYSVTDFSKHTSSPTAIVYDVGETSFTFRSTGGLHAGTTSFVLAQYTIKSMIAAFNALSGGLAGVEGGIVAELSTGCYSGDTTERINKIGATNILGLANKTVVAQENTNGISILIPGTLKQRNHITAGTVNLTFNSGTPTAYIYDGVSSTNTVIDKETLTISAVDGSMNLSPIGYMTSKIYGAGTLFEVYNSTDIKAGWAVISYFKE